MRRDLLPTEERDLRGWPLWPFLKGIALCKPRSGLSVNRAVVVLGFAGAGWLLQSGVRFAQARRPSIAGAEVTRAADVRRFLAG